MHYFGGAISVERLRLMGQESAVVVVPARISAVIHETEHRPSMVGKGQTLCVIVIVGDSREDVLDRRKPPNEF